jgi:hypothetical protein
MKMKNILKTYFVVTILTLLQGCGDYLDVNTDPNRAKSISLDLMLPAAIEATSNNHYLVSSTTGQFTQHLASYFVGGTDSYQETRMGTAWTGLYLPALSNLDLMAKQAHEQTSPYYEGIAKILQAINLGMATDAWGDVPFSLAFQGEKDLTPAFDTQEEIYTSINTLLDDAVLLLQQPTSLFKPGVDDMVYAGKIASWIKLAYSLKARYALHLTLKDEAGAVSKALAALPLAISDTTEDFQLKYNPVNRNPWFNNVSSPITTGNFTVGPSEQIINLMNGTYYTVIDPRLPKMFDNLKAATYSGLVNGQGGGGNSRLSVSTWYGRQTAPMLMVTFFETKFMEAEARFLNGQPLEAYNAYLAGITAHLRKLSVPTADIQTYITHPSVAVGSGSLTLELILKEKYIALFLNPEAWTDVRRYQYSNTLYRGMDLPVNYNTALGGEFIRRVLYPTEELNRNSAEATSHIVPMQTKMWWEN